MTLPFRQAGVPVATGEHVYTRWQVKELLAARVRR
jgi:L-alanine-DL-glutamate epimerase-like enolase superfamily enzyme